MEMRRKDDYKLTGNVCGGNYHLHHGTVTEFRMI